MKGMQNGGTPMQLALLCQTGDTIASICSQGAVAQTGGAASGSVDAYADVQMEACGVLLQDAE